MEPVACIIKKITSVFDAARSVNDDPSSVIVL